MKNMQKSVKVAVIGAGKLGSKHAEVYAKLPGAELVGIYDTHLDRSKEVAKHCGSRAFSDLNELIGIVDAVGACILSQTEDIANARIRFSNRAVCDLTASRVTPDKVRKIRIFQDDAYISLDYITQEAQIYTKENGQIRHKKIDITKSDSLKAELSDFIDCVRTGKRPLVSGEEGRAALALALQISKQIKDDGA